MALRRDPHAAPAAMPRSRGCLVACPLVCRQLVSRCHSLCMLQKIHSEAPLHWIHGIARGCRGDGGGGGGDGDGGGGGGGQLLLPSIPFTVYSELA